jgi:uncharacterized membrane protein YfcA
VTASAIGLLIGFTTASSAPAPAASVFLFVRLLGYDFLNASASAKLLNLASNAAAAAVLAQGPCLVALSPSRWPWPMLGSMLGTWMALRHGTGFVRTIFIGVVSLLILKTGWDAFKPL